MLMAECSGADVMTGAASPRFAAADRLRRRDQRAVPGGRLVLVVACGGLSIPKMGATSFGYDIARQFGLKIAPTRPALVPFTWSPEDPAAWSDLSGVADGAIASLRRPACVSREDAVYASRPERARDLCRSRPYWQPGATIHLNLLPDTARRREAARGARTALKNALADFLPKRLAERWLELHSLEG